MILTFKWIKNICWKCPNALLDYDLRHGDTVSFLCAKIVRTLLCTSSIIDVFQFQSKGSKWKWVLTTVKLGVFTKPDNGGFRFGIVNYTFEFNHFIFSNAQSGTGFDTFNLYLGWRHCNKDTYYYKSIFRRKKMTFQTYFFKQIY